MPCSLFCSRFQFDVKGTYGRLQVLPGEVSIRVMAPGHVRLARAAREDAALVHHITQAAYAEYRGVLHPPSSVDQECVADVERALDEGGAVLARCAWASGCRYPGTSRCIAAWDTKSSAYTPILKGQTRGYCW